MRKRKTRSGSTSTRGAPHAQSKAKTRPKTGLVRYNQQLDLLPPPKQGALLVTRSNTPLRHVGEYLRYQRKEVPLATSYRKTPSKHYLRTEMASLLAECQRRKARREVLHAKGHAGSKKRYSQRRPPGRTIDCKKS